MLRLGTLCHSAFMYIHTFVPIYLCIWPLYVTIKVHEPLLYGAFPAAAMVVAAAAAAAKCGSSIRTLTHNFTHIHSHVHTLWHPQKGMCGYTVYWFHGKSWGRTRDIHWMTCIWLSYCNAKNWKASAYASTCKDTERAGESVCEKCECYSKRQPSRNETNEKKLLCITGWSAKKHWRKKQWHFDKARESENEVSIICSAVCKCECADSDRFASKSASFSAYYKLITFIYRMNWVQICTRRRRRRRGSFSWLMEIIIRICNVIHFSIKYSITILPPPLRAPFIFPLVPSFFVTIIRIVRSHFVTFACTHTYALMHVWSVCASGNVIVPIKSNQKSIISYL